VISMSRPVSSFTSRMTHWLRVSPMSMVPPGSAVARVGATLQEYMAVVVDDQGGAAGHEAVGRRPVVVVVVVAPAGHRGCPPGYETAVCQICSNWSAKEAKSRTRRARAGAGCGVGSRGRGTGTG